MKKLMKIGLASSLGLALAIPACAQNGTQTTTITSSQSPTLIGTLGTTSSTTSVATIVAISAAEAVASTGHTK